MSAPESTGFPYDLPHVSLRDFHYDLPEDRIATFPLAERDSSRLLVCDVRSARIDHHTFSDLPSLIPSDAMLVMNDTRVVRARIVMRKETGGRIEFFLLEPAGPSRDPAVALAARGTSTWTCMIGGARKIRSGDRLEAVVLRDAAELSLRVTVLGEDAGGGYRVAFAWTPDDASFAELLETIGTVPLPPYIKRATSPGDAEGYQTVYATNEGAVAAPTAGLHFTRKVLAELEAKGVAQERVTLHVGAGTFRPVKGERIEEHRMHEERIVIARGTLDHLRRHAALRAASAGHPFVPVGTTTLRTLESLYWFGVRIIAGEVTEGEDLLAAQWDPYRLERKLAGRPDPSEALDAVEEWRRAHDLDTIAGRTGLLIVPGYRFAFCDALITNFHQPGSTLILLVGALLGRELWRQVYDQALANGYRFLSYGDSSLLIAGRF
jgi:S-adenosylmethionine:tRNA ribosyltransferase-isomerase